MIHTNTHIIYITYVLTHITYIAQIINRIHINYRTRMVKLIFKAFEKKLFYNIFFLFLSKKQRKTFKKNL